MLEKSHEASGAPKEALVLMPSTASGTFSRSRLCAQHSQNRSALPVCGVAARLTDAGFVAALVRVKFMCDDLGLDAAQLVKFMLRICANCVEDFRESVANLREPSRELSRMRRESAKLESRTFANVSRMCAYLCKIVVNMCRMRVVVTHVTCPGPQRSPGRTDAGRTSWTDADRV
jgi:hypothetical protein